VLGKIDEEIRKKISKRILVITKNADDETILDIKEALREIFKDFDDERQIMDLGNSFSVSEPKYLSACRDIFE
jgi:phosphoheptose isomerase